MRSKPVGGHDVGVVVAQQADGLPDLGHVERQVGVGVQHQVAGGAGEAGLHRPAELAVLGVVDGDDVGIGGGEIVGQARRRVRRRVVDDDHLVVDDLTGIDEHLALGDRGSDGALDVVLLVPHRQEDAQLLEGLAGLRRRRPVRHPQQGIGRSRPAPVGRVGGRDRPPLAAHAGRARSSVARRDVAEPAAGAGRFGCAAPAGPAAGHPARRRPRRLSRRRRSWPGSSPPGGSWCWCAGGSGSSSVSPRCGRARGRSASPPGGSARRPTRASSAC